MIESVLKNVQLWTGFTESCWILYFLRIDKLRYLKYSSNFPVLLWTNSVVCEQIVWPVKTDLTNVYFHFAFKNLSFVFLQLLGWLEKKLPNEKKLPAELKDCVAPLFNCLEDRNANVRQAAQASVQYFMAHIGYDAMSKATAKLDVSMKQEWMQTWWLE